MKMIVPDSKSKKAKKNKAQEARQPAEQKSNDDGLLSSAPFPAPMALMPSFRSAEIGQFLRDLPDTRSPSTNPVAAQSMLLQLSNQRALGQTQAGASQTQRFAQLMAMQQLTQQPRALLLRQQQQQPLLLNSLRALNQGTDSGRPLSPNSLQAMQLALAQEQLQHQVRQQQQQQLRQQQEQQEQLMRDYLANLQRRSGP